MESTSSCVCDASDPTEYLEKLKKKYISRTAKLQAQQQDLEKKIIKMEMFISKRDHSPVSDQCNPCDGSNVPRIFPETPVRDVSGIPKTITDVIHQPQPPPSQPCSFFQKMMDKGRSILSITCQCPSVGINKTTSISGTPMTATTETTFHTTESTVRTTETLITTESETEKTLSEVPTKDEDFSVQQNVIDYDNTLTEKSSGSSCSCDFTDPSSHQEIGCTCQIIEPDNGQQASLDHTTSSQRNTENEPLSSSLSKSEKCPWQEETPPSVLISGKCSCENCTCDSSLVLDDGNLAAEIGQKQSEKMPQVALFVERGETSAAEVQVAVENKEIYVQLAKNNANKCVTCCKLPTCPAYKTNLSAGIQASSQIKSKGSQIQKETSNVGSNYSASRVPCRAICAAPAVKKSRPGDGDLREAQVQVRETVSNPEKPKKHQDGGNQCAFIGSPLLDHNEIFGNKSKSRLPCDCNTTEGLRKICKESASLTSADIVEMQNIAEMAKKEKQMRAQIEELQKREQQYQKATRNVENVFTKTSNLCCQCHAAALPTGMNVEIEKISRELRLENEILKSELVEMKLELRHCLEKIEGPMKLKLQAEKQKCENLHRELQDASKNILLSQDAYSREMNQLKLQLCCACSNITDLNQMNQRLKDEMSNLDCLCQKLEDDLIKQKLNEAETIKRITTRRSGGNAAAAAPTGMRSTSEEFKCDSSLDVIARKLSKTIKDLAPCEECSKLPTELASAAKCIKELTDMVRKRKVGAAFSAGSCNCQSGVPSREMLEQCCTCCQGDTGDLSRHRTKTAEEITVKTLLPVPESFVEKNESSKLDVDNVQSSYYSAGEVPCSKIGMPCAPSKGTGVTKDHEGQWPGSHIVEPSRKDKYCTSPCSRMMLPVKDQAVQEVPKFEKATGTVVDAKPTEEIDKSADATSILQITESIIDKVFEAKPEVTGFITTKTEALESGEGLKTVTEVSGETAAQKPTTASSSGVAEVEEATPHPDATIGEELPEDIEEPQAPREIPFGVAEVEEVTPHPDATIGEELPEDIEEPQAPREIPFEENRFGGEFPVDVANAAYSLAEPADVVHMTSIVTDSGTLNVITTGPLGVIETTLTYTDDGQIEVVSGVYDRDAEEKRAADAALERNTSPTSEDGPCTPEVRCSSMEKLSGYEICDESKVCHDIPKKAAPMLPVDSSKISGASGLQADTSYTTSAYESELTSKIDSGSFGIRPDGSKTPDLTSAYGESSAPIRYPPTTTTTPIIALSGEVKDPNLTKYFGQPDGRVELDLKELGEERSEELFTSPGGFEEQKSVRAGLDEQSPGQGYEGHAIPFGEPGSKEVHGESVAQIVSSAGREESEEAEGGTSTTGEVKSGEVFTPDLGFSDLEEETREKAAAETVSPDQPEILVESQVLDDELLSSEEVTAAKVKESIHPDVSMEAGEIPLDETVLGAESVSAMEPVEGEAPCPPETSKTRDCGCQSKVQTDQSCQCCECKTIGISTSGDKETITEKMGKTLQETIEDAKTDSDTEFVSISEVTENIQAQTSSIQEQGDVPEDIAAASSITKPEDSITSYLFENYPELKGKSLEEQEEFLKGKGIHLSERAREKLKTLSENVDLEETESSYIVTEELLAEHPELAGMTAEEQLTALKSLSIVPSSAEQEAEIEITEEILRQRPELATMSPEEQQTFLRNIMSEASKYVTLTEDIIAKHPELITMSIADQQKSLKSLGYKQPSAQKHVDSSLQQKHPELAGKSIEEQQAMLKDLRDELPETASEGFQKVVDYDASKPSVKLSKLVDKELLDKHPELADKTSEEQEEILKELGYHVPEVVSSAKTPSAQIHVDSVMLEKHPKLVGKTSKEQQEILKELGYSVPAVVSSAKTPSAQIHVDSVMLEKHPELVGKTSKEQQEMLKELGYSVPAAVSSAKTPSAQIHVDSVMLQKHPKLVGKTSKEQQEMLKELGYSVPAAVSSAKTPSAQIHVDSVMLQKHPKLVGKTSKEQQEMLKELGYSVPAAVSSAKTPSAQIHVDSVMLQKHPELVGKTSKEQVEILGQLGYSVPAVVSSAKTPSAQIHVDSVVLEKHPELVGKTSKQQEKMLKDLGYSVPAVVSSAKTPSAQIHVDSVMLEKHPELVGKTSKEQVEILEQLGYSVPAVVSSAKTPSAQIHVDSVMLQKHPELVGKSSQEQNEILKDLGYAVPAEGPPSQLLESQTPSIAAAATPDSKFVTPEQSSKDIAVTCKAPCSTTGTPIRKRSPSQSAKSIPRLIPRRPSSKEASISCRAPCRSKATLHSVTPKESAKKIISIGDVSEAFARQQRPQSRDGSVSCKASCKTISVQSSRGKGVKDLVAAKSDTTTTSSSISEKEKLKKQPKKSLDEVPSIVSQLSDKERPAIESTSRKPKLARKKRPKAFDCMKCDCKDPCECQICAPGKKKSSRTLKRTVRSCDCPPNMMMVPQMIVMPPMQMTYSMPPTGHATNCRCNACIYRENVPSRSNVKGRNYPDDVRRKTKQSDISRGEADAKEKTKHADTSTDEADAKPNTNYANISTDEAEFRKKPKHLSSCECIDCLCMPKIKKLANTIEYPIIYDSKQIYQVKVKCDTCVNAQSARRHLEQQAAARSRIPISTSTANPPTYRSATSATNPAREGESSGSVYSSIACDCEECKCNECPDEKIPKSATQPPAGMAGQPSATQPPAGMAGKPSSTHGGDKNCCCKSSPCECQPCTVEELTRKLKEAEDKLAEVQKKTGLQIKPSGDQKHGEIAEDEPCNCEVCTCPGKDLMPKTKDAEEDEICTCVDCVCPGADLMKPSAVAPPPSAGDADQPSAPPTITGDADHPADCDCVECVCPGADLLKPSETKPPPPTSAGDADHPSDCNCSMCTCPGIDDYRKSSHPSQGPVVKPSVAMQESASVKPPVGAVPSAVGAGDEECTCAVCECPGKTNLPPKPSETESKTETCDCSDCKCSPCADSSKRITSRILDKSSVEDCDCSECLCVPCADPKKHTEKVPSQLVPPKVSAKFTDMPEKVPHPADCTCDECRCLEEIIQTESVHQTDTGVQPIPREEEIHVSQCACPKCICTECDSKGTHALVCKCLECRCTDCPVMNVEDKPSVAGTPSQHTPGDDCACIKCVCDMEMEVAGTHSQHKPGGDCTCIKCVCDICDDASKMKVGEAPKPSEAIMAAKSSHITACLCGECICADCDKMKPKVEHVEGCRCSECLCVECPLGKVVPVKPSALNVKESFASPVIKTSVMADRPSGKVGPSALATSVMADQPSVLIAVTDSHAQGECICKHCICSECKGKMGAELQGPSGVVQGPSGIVKGPSGVVQEPSGVLQGPSGIVKGPSGVVQGASGVVKGPSGVLQGPSGVVLPSQGAQSLAGPIAPVDEPCTCAVCDCKPCFDMESPNEECTCQVCECVVCSKTLPDGTQKVAATGSATQPKAVETGTHSPACACEDCRCGPGPQPKSKRNLGAEIDLHDPPPFEPYDRIECDCKACDCIICNELKAVSTGTGRLMGRTVGTHQSHVGMMPESYVAPPFEVPTRIDCIAVCKECTCIFCNKEGPQQRTVAAQPSLPFAVPAQPSVAFVETQPSVHVEPVVQATASTHSPTCTCTICTCAVPGLTQIQQMSSAQMQHAHSAQIQNAPSTQIQVAPSKQIQLVRSVQIQETPSAQMQHASSAQVQQAPSAQMQQAPSAQMQQAPSAQIQQAPSTQIEHSVTTGQTADSFFSAKESAMRPQPSEVTPIHCNCPTCTCEEDLIKSTMPAASSAIRSVASAPIRQDPSSTVKPLEITSSKLPSGVVITASVPTEGYQSAETLVLPQPDVHTMYPEHPPARAPCDCPPGRCSCQPCNDKTIQPVGSAKISERSAKQPLSAVRTMDNLTLVKSIQAANKENCECKEQIEEIKRTLEKIRCSCNEAVYRSTQSMGQQMGAESGHFTVQPFVKQASPFGQTMSGLKMALNNLQDKCKAKDKMIEAMTAELAERGDLEMFDKVLDNSDKMHTALDYDQAHDIKSSDISRLVTNVIYAPTQVKDEGTAPIREVASKGIEVRSHKHKKKASSKGMKASHDCDNCDCSLPPIVQTQEKDCQKLDLTGFEVVDIRRITDDSLIVKWNAPKNQKVQGYDIFVNGTMASKVMSGTRTSAMMHSLDLSKSVQITIYAATRCGRVDPPAIAIYEIKG